MSLLGYCTWDEEGLAWLLGADPHPSLHQEPRLEGYHGNLATASHMCQFVVYNVGECFVENCHSLLYPLPHHFLWLEPRISVPFLFPALEQDQ